jgi:hypothetical protein
MAEVQRRECSCLTSGLTELNRIVQVRSNEFLDRFVIVICISFFWLSDVALAMASLARTIIVSASCVAWVLRLVQACAFANWTKPP